ncbi:MAG: hypothetical protein LBI43_06930 [Streptococcaceae bacterium]|jgi:hypothetical protein|nr:hypothetical protein [Streptococcaceae bacterium]
MSHKHTGKSLHRKDAELLQNATRTGKKVIFSTGAVLAVAGASVSLQQHTAKADDTVAALAASDATLASQTETAATAAAPQEAFATITYFDTRDNTTVGTETVIVDSTNPQPTIDVPTGYTTAFAPVNNGGNSYTVFVTPTNDTLLSSMTAATPQVASQVPNSVATPAPVINTDDENAPQVAAPNSAAPVTQSVAATSSAAPKSASVQATTTSASSVANASTSSATTTTTKADHSVLKDINNATTATLATGKNALESLLGPTKTNSSTPKGSAFTLEVIAALVAAGVISWASVVGYSGFRRVREEKKEAQRRAMRASAKAHPETKKSMDVAFL